MSTTKNRSQSSTLSTDQLELLNYLLEEENNSDSQAAFIVPRVRTEPAPLSFAQQRLWFLHKLEPDSPAYNIPAAYRLKGDLNVAALEQSFNELIRRQEILRTTFLLIDGEPMQVVGPISALKLAIEDLRPLQETEWGDRLRRSLAEDATRPFKLDQGPLLRIALVQTADDEHILSLNMHRELAIVYGAICKGEALSLPDLEIQYADYAIWQREWLQGDNLENQLSYWRNQLNGVPVLKLPTDRPRPPVQSYRGAKYSFDLSPDLSDQLEALSRQEGVTLFMALLAACQTLLYRYTRQDDISVGTPIAGRTKTETESLIGFFVNTLVLRANLSGEPTFRNLLARVRNVALEAYDHQDLPFEKLVQELNPDRTLSHTPLFQVMFTFQNASESVLDLPGLTVSRLETSSSRIAKFDLAVSVQKNSKSLAVSLSYNTDLFDSGTIRRMSEHFKTLLQEVAANPDRSIGELPLLTQAEHDQFVMVWNDTASDYPRDKCIHDLFEEQARRAPDAVAVVFEEQQLTYRELNARSDQLARCLKALGVGPDVLVG